MNRFVKMEKHVGYLSTPSVRPFNQMSAVAISIVATKPKPNGNNIGVSVDLKYATDIAAIGTPITGACQIGMLPLR